MRMLAKIEEKAIYERCGNRNMYVNIAINTLKMLRDQDVSGISNDDETTELKKNEKKNALTGIILYRHLKDYLLTEEQLHENNYPQPNPDKPGSVLLNPGTTTTLVNDPSKKMCCRCGKIYGVTPEGKHSSVEECNYHFGRLLSQKGTYLVVLFHLFDEPVPKQLREEWNKICSSMFLGGLETWYSCCEGVIGSPGCQVAKVGLVFQNTACFRTRVATPSTDLGCQ
ncbi:RNA exonuclease 1 homolog [Phacochoerus africanus]|uniref:RNA exonuclease 1 homolog n=1 Tax=Phacochoerus africanus TaxID=41426 RepID=UPI001FDA2878|nr:RNA exonuclease 1 homolog [Phacochoerus africanus]